MNDRLTIRPAPTAPVGPGPVPRRPPARSGRPQLSHAEFLELILQDELLVRQQRQIDRRVKAASFREVKPLDDFDFAFNPSIKRAQIFDLATCRFIREAKDVLLVGPPGTGKSFLVQALGYQAIKQASSCSTARSSTWSATSCTTRRSEATGKMLARYLKPDLLIIDDMGMKNLPRRAAKSCSRSSCGATKPARR